MKYSINTLLLLFVLIKLTAQDSSFIRLNNSHFNVGDTINIKGILPNNQKEKINISTLHIWVENIETHKSWKFRYPIIQGKSSAYIVIDPSISKGNYAFNFIVQKDFLNIDGKIKNYNKKDTSLYFQLHTKNNWSYRKSFRPDEKGHFAINRILYEDSAFFSFASHKNNSTEPEIVNFKSSLDSIFTPAIIYTQIIAIGETITLQNRTLNTLLILDLFSAILLTRKR